LDSLPDPFGHRTVDRWRGLIPWWTAWPSARPAKARSWVRYVVMLTGSPPRRDTPRHPPLAAQRTKVAAQESWW